MRWLILFLLLVTTVVAISEKPYCYAGSDYYVLKYGNYQPELIALYDNTEIFFDINDDGVWEYRTKIDAYKPFYPKTSWELKDWSKIHANKPIAYNQKMHQLTSHAGNSYHYECIPPINALSNEIVLVPIFAPYNWKIISKNATLNIIDKNNVLTTEHIDISKSISIPSKDLTYSEVWYVNSTKPLVAISQFGFSSSLGTDFIKSNSRITRIAVPYDDTVIDFDQNGDGIFDESSNFKRGFKDVILTPGTRIKSDKKINVFEYNWHRDMDLSQLIPTKSVNNELFAKIYANKKTFITGLFNDDYGFENTTYDLFNNINSDSGSVASNANVFIEGFSDAVRIKANKPVNSFYRYEYLSSWLRFQNNMQTIEPFVSSFSKLKFLGVNDSALINIRVHNPTSYDLDDVTVTVRFLDLFGGDIDYYFGVRNLDDDSVVIANYQSSIVPIDLGGVREFDVFIGILNAGEYANIDYYLTTPLNTGSFVLPPASLEFKSDIWTIN